ncbi:hypothetical protein [Enterobacter asburiae]|uniref:hypothetical protein n=1 Tax=Enterobacter asburiae TaxID=61645 RepID=UPI0006AC3E13|nr:hypothetical protein [Enterobacter asburiae]
MMGSLIGGGIVQTKPVKTTMVNHGGKLDLAFLSLIKITFLNRPATRRVFAFWSLPNGSI